MHFNQLTLIGRLTADPIKEKLPNGFVAKFSLAVDRGWSDETDFHKVSFFGNNVDYVMEYLKKGNLALISGSAHIDIDTDDQNNKKVYPKVHGQSFRKLEKKDTHTHPFSPLRAPAT